MTAKDKAEEIIEKYYQAIKDVLDVNNAFYYSQQCALIAVDEILNTQVVKDGYWQQVKTEIEKL